MSKIVVVDNSSTHGNFLAELAGSLDEDSSVVCFTDTTAALDWAGTTSPNLVVVNANPPDIDAADLTRRLRAQSRGFDIPIIVVTAREERRLRYLALEAGANEFLLLPVDHVEFRAKARNLLALRKHQQILKDGLASMEHRLQLSDRLRRKELSESEAKLRLVTNAMPAMICASDPDGRCITLNSFQGEVFGIDPEGCFGRSLVELFGDDYGGRHRDWDRQVFRSGEVLDGIEETLTNQQGEERVFLTTKSPLRDFTGQVVNVVTVAVDITERKAGERSLLEAKEVAEYANRSKTDFLANMSHELRTPLNAIIGFADIMKVELLGPVGTPKYREYASDILASARHLLGLMNDMLDVSRIESGQFRLNETSVDVATTIEDVLRLVGGRAKDVGVEVRSTIATDLPLLRADTLRLKQVLLNLLSNAIKFTPSGGSVKLSAVVTETGAIRVQVTDTGIGIRDEDLQTVVSRFGRIDNTVNAKHAGAGLGVPLAIDLITLHGGSLDIASRESEGTTMTIHFPPDRTLVRNDQADPPGAASAGDLS